MANGKVVQGKYIVIDGIDGGGKTTLFNALRSKFIPWNEVEGSNFMYTREPGGTPLGETLRTLILTEVMDPFAELCLLLAQRREVRILVDSFLRKGVHVISDRSDSATFAYQIQGRNLPHLESLFWRLHSVLLPHPTLYIFLDISPEIAIKRMSGRENGSEKADRFEKEQIDFFHNVRDGFVEFSKKTATPSVFVDASQSPDEVASEVAKHIADHLVSE